MVAEVLVSSSASNISQLLNTLINGLGPAAGQTVGILNALGQQNFINGGKINVLNDLQTMQGNAGNNANSSAANLLPWLQGTMQNGGTNYFNGAQGAQGWLNQGLQGTGAFKDMADPNGVPGLSSVLQNLLQQSNTATQGAGTALNIGQGNAASMAPLYNQGSNLLGGNTSNDRFGQMLQGLASQTLNNGGYTPQLNQVNSQGQSLLGPQQGVGQTLGAAGNIMGQIGNPVLPMDKVISMAMNQSATASGQQEEALRRQLLNRTGVTGPAVASGQQNELLANMGQQALQNQSSAVQNAIMGQQNAGLQGLGAATGMFNAGTGANLGYQGQGLNAILQAAAQAQGNQGLMGQLGIGGGNLGLQTASTGGQLLNSFNNTSLGGLGALSSLLGQGTGANQALSGNLFGAQNLNQTQNQNQYQALASMLGLQGGANSTALQAMLGSANPLSSALGEYLSQQTSSGTAQPSLFSQNYQMPPQFVQNLGLGGAGGGAGGSTAGKGITIPGTNITLGGNGSTPPFNPGGSSGPSVGSGPGGIPPFDPYNGPNFPNPGPPGTASSNVVFEGDTLNPQIGNDYQTYTDFLSAMGIDPTFNGSTGGSQGQPGGSYGGPLSSYDPSMLGATDPSQGYNSDWNWA